VAAPGGERGLTVSTPVHLSREEMVYTIDGLYDVIWVGTNYRVRS